MSLDTGGARGYMQGEDAGGEILTFVVVLFCLPAELSSNMVLKFSRQNRTVFVPLRQQTWGWSCQITYEWTFHLPASRPPQPHFILMHLISLLLLCHVVASPPVSPPITSLPPPISSHLNLLTLPFNPFFFLSHELSILNFSRLFAQRCLTQARIKAEGAGEQKT